MRVRYEMYKDGYGLGYKAKCDLTEKQAKKIFNELKLDAKCGWAELISEEDDSYLEIIDEFEKIKLAKKISKLV